MGFNRKILLLSLLLLGLFLSGCSDDTGAVLGITDAEGTFSFLLYDLPGAVESGSEQGIIWARILFGILITVILFGLSEVFIKVMKGARFIASLVVALIAVIGMPDKLMNEVFLVWGGGLYLLLAGVPVVLLTWYLFKKGEEGNRLHYVMKAFAAAILVYTTRFLSASSTGGFLEKIFGYFSLLSLVYVLALGYFIYKIFSPTSSASDDGKVVGSKFLHHLPGTTRRYMYKELKRLPQDVRDIKHVCDEMRGAIGQPNWTESNVDEWVEGMRGKLSDAEMIHHHMEEISARLSSEIGDLENSPVKTNLQTKETALVAAIPAFKTALVALETPMEDLRGFDWTTTSSKDYRDKLNEIKSLAADAQSKYVPVRVSVVYMVKALGRA